MNKVDFEALRKDLKEGVQRARQGENVGELHSRFSSMVREGTLPKALLRDFGWLNYYQLKYTHLSSVLPRKRLLLQHLNLDLNHPSLLHSLILAEAVKLKKNSPAQFRLRDFVDLWKLENLRKEDWEKFNPEKGHSCNSLVENLIGACMKEIRRYGGEASEEFGSLLRKAMDVYPSSPHLPLYEPIVLASQGKKEEALAAYQRLLRRWPRKFFLWSSAEEMLPRADIDTRISLLCKAITLVRDQSFLGDIRLRLANLLQKKGLYAYARHELETHLHHYVSRHWNVKRWHETLSGRLNASAPGVAPSPTPYASFLALADGFLQRPLAAHA